MLDSGLALAKKRWPHNQTMRFYLGTHEPAWLPRTTTPLFVSYSRLIRRKSLPRARCEWALDSGAFTQLIRHGRWTTPMKQYAESVDEIARKVGRLQWASIQDWLCTPVVLKSTGLTIRQHQTNTIRSLGELRITAPSVNWIPVLQGWDLRSYMEHAAAYRAEGFDLTGEAVVGVGSLANRKSDPAVHRILLELRDAGIKMHGFGLSTVALARVHPLLQSADSLTWSFIARRRQLKHPRCSSAHSVCNNCLSYALAWRRNLVNSFSREGLA